MKAPRPKTDQKKLKLQEQPSVLVQCTEEFRTGPFSILSPRAIDRLVTLFCRVSADAFYRGVEEGKCQIQKEKKTK